MLGIGIKNRDQDLVKSGWGSLPTFAPDFDSRLWLPTFPPDFRSRLSLPNSIFWGWADKRWRSKLVTGCKNSFYFSQAAFASAAQRLGFCLMIIWSWVQTRLGATLFSSISLDWQFFLLQRTKTSVLTESCNPVLQQNSRILSGRGRKQMWEKLVLSFDTRCQPKQAKIFSSFNVYWWRHPVRKRRTVVLVGLEPGIENWEAGVMHTWQFSPRGRREFFFPI